MVDGHETVTRQPRTALHHEMLAEQLVDLANQHLHGRDREVNRGWLRSRKRERWHLENCAALVAIAQVHATLAVAKAGQGARSMSFDRAPSPVPTGLAPSKVHRHRAS